MKESSDCKYNSQNSLDSLAQCRGCKYENVCNELENRAYELIRSLGLHQKLDDPWNVENIIRYFESQGVDCNNFSTRLKRINKATIKKQSYLINAPAKKEKKATCAFFEIIHNLEAAEK